MNTKSKKILSEIRSYVIITLGLLCYVLGWSIFILPNSLVGGGVTGISAIIQYWTGFEISYSYFIINAVLLVVGFLILGGGFGVKTIYAIVVSSLLFKVVPGLIPESFIQEIAINNGPMLCCIIGGALDGVGMAMTFANGGSTGGTDIVALIINKYRSISPGKIIVLMDIIIIASSMIVPSDGTWGSKFAVVIYGFIMSGVLSFTLDMVLSGNKQSVQILIFSKNYDVIADRITREAGRGVTILNSRGWYTKEEGKVALVIVRKNESSYILSIIKEVDKNAFLSVGNVMGVYGKGFEQIKSGLKK
ncbi:MAG: YitT family protein [Bacteroidales bacterium]|nr:YitT family protein [Bacteroidales bacterium]